MRKALPVVITRFQIFQKQQQQQSRMSTVIRMNVLKGIESMVRDGALSAIDFCGSKYGFDPEEAKREMMSSMKVSLRKKEVGIKKGVKGVVLPWGRVREGCCNALRLNQGLYSQCMGVKLGEGELCKGCLKQCEKNDSGFPDYGMMGDREGWEYVDAKGKSPVPYMKVMLKNGWTREVVEEEALLVGFEIDERHFEVPEAKKRGKKPSEKAPVTEEKKSRGRPKKESKVVEQGDNLEDLFAQLQLETQPRVQEEVVVIVVPEKKKGETEEERSVRKLAEKLAKQQAKSASSVPVEVQVQVPVQVEEPVQVEKKSSKKKSAAAVSDDSSTGSSTKSADKAAKKAAKDQEKMELAAKKEQEKMELAAKKEQEKMEKAVKEQREKLEKDAKKEQDRLEKEAKKEQDRLNKEQEKLTKKSAKKVPVAPEVVPVVVPVVVLVPVIASAISSVSSEELEEESGSDSESDSGSDSSSDSGSDSSSDSGSDSSSDEDEAGAVKDLVEVKTLVKDPEVLSGDGDDDEMEDTKEFKIDGVIYLLAKGTNNVYTNDDENTHLGVWDPATKKLVPVVEQEEEDDEDMW